jgi:hypothetical protein
MKIGLLYPCVAALIEKIATIFPGITVVGPPCDELSTWDKRILPLASAIDRQAEWKAVGLDIHFDQRPYSQIDFSVYDLLIESVETFFYAQDWKNHYQRIECPIIVKTCWSNKQADFPAEYIQSRKRFPFLLEMPSHLAYWKASPFEDVTLVYNPVGDWWFERPWSGSKEAALFVLAGKDIWRPSDKTVCGVDLYEKLCERFPGKIHHQDGAVDFKTASEMSQLFSEHRVFVNLDRQDARPLCTSFTEALAAGMPVIARDLPTLSYKGFIDTNGICTDDFEEMCEEIETLFNVNSYAALCSNRSKEIALENFSVNGIREVYLAAADRAKAAFR